MKRYPLANQLWITVLLGLTGCYSLQAQPTIEALLERPSAQTREVLQQRIGAYFNGQPVKLADDVFTTSSTVLIERDGVNTSSINQRGIPAVDSFTLLVIDNHCMLRHDQSKTLLELASIRCKAA